MPRKTAEQRKQDEQNARPFADGSTAPFAGRTEDERRSIAEQIAADKASGLSGNELRAKYGERLTGPARRKVLRTFGLDSPATIARSYDEYRDGQPRSGSRHAREHGARAEERRAALREEADAALVAARKAPKGRTKASREAHAALVAECEARVASLA